jgi:hypothetical protein
MRYELLAYIHFATITESRFDSLERSIEELQSTTVSLLQGNSNGGSGQQH